MNNEIQVIWKDLYQELFTFINSKVKNDEVSKDLLKENGKNMKIYLPLNPIRKNEKRQVPI